MDRRRYIQGLKGDHKQSTRGQSATWPGTEIDRSQNGGLCHGCRIGLHSTHLALLALEKEERGTEGKGSSLGRGVAYYPL